MFDLRAFTLSDISEGGVFTDSANMRMGNGKILLVQITNLHFLSSCNICMYVNAIVYSSFQYSSTLYFTFVLKQQLYIINYGLKCNCGHLVAKFATDL